MGYFYERYAYDGPVMIFDKCVADHWRAETAAPSESKAKNNLTYQAKKACNLQPGTRVTLPGKIVKIS